MVGDADYFRKRFEERIWESEVGAYLQAYLEEAEADKAVSYLVEGLLIEIGAL